MKRSARAASMAACFYVGFAAPLFAAGATATGTANTRSGNERAVVNKPAPMCLSDLRAFDRQIEKDAIGWAGPATATAIRCSVTDTVVC